MMLRRTLAHPTPLALLLLLVAVTPAGAQDPPAAPVGTPSAAADSLLNVASRDRIKGDENAPVTIIEFSDFQCPFCREFTRTTYPALDSAYIRTGRARLVFINLPLPSHGQAWQAAEAAMCAGAQESFWPMHDRLFAEQESWSGSADAGAFFERLAAEIGLDLDAFGECTGADRMAPLILGDVMQAVGSGAGATPTFIINGETVLSGARPFSEFQQAIEGETAGNRQ